MATKQDRKGPNIVRASDFFVFHQLPLTKTKLTSETRQRWISAISREDLTEKYLSNDRVCSEHFVSGKPAQQWDKHNFDWIPTLKLGHSKKSTAAERTSRALSLEQG